MEGGVGGAEPDQPANDAGALVLSRAGAFFGGGALSAICAPVGGHTVGEADLPGTWDILGDEIAGAVLWLFGEELAGEGLRDGGTCVIYCFLELSEHGVCAGVAGVRPFPAGLRKAELTG